MKSLRDVIAYLTAVVLMSVATQVGAATFAFGSAPLGVTGNFTPPCGVPVCLAYTSGVSKVLATVTFAAALAPGLVNAPLTPSAFNVTDGSVNYVNGDGLINRAQFFGTTDGSGNLVGLSLFVSRWQTVPAFNGRIDDINVPFGADLTVQQNGRCATFVAITGLCNGIAIDPPNDSKAFSTLPLTLVAPALAGGGASSTSAVPALDNWSVLLLAALVGAAGLSRSFNRNRRLH